MSEFTIACPNCGVQLSAADEYVGHRVSCPECGVRFVIRDEAERGDAAYPRIEAGGQIGHISHNSVPPANSHTTMQGDNESGHISNLIKVLSAIAAIAVVGYNIWVHFHNARIRMEGGEYQYTVKNIVNELAEKNLAHDGVEIMKVYDFLINDGGKDCKATIDVRDKKNGNLESLHCSYKVREINGGKLVEVYDFKFDEDVFSRDNERKLTVDELKAEVSRMLSENICKRLREEGCKNVSANVQYLSLTLGTGNKYHGNVEVTCKYDGETETFTSHIEVTYDGETIAYELKTDE